MGRSWTGKSSFNTNHIPLWALLVHGDNIFVGSDLGLYLSKNNGLTWEEINNGIGYTSGFSSLDRIQCLTEKDGYIFAGSDYWGMYRARLTDFITEDVSSNLPPNNEIQIFPNPAESYISVNLSPEYQSSQIKIYSVEGILVYQTSDVFKTSDVSAKIDVSSFTPGVYYVKIEDRVCRFVKI